MSTNRVTDETSLPKQVTNALALTNVPLAFGLGMGAVYR
jgi:hypothetical protein